MKKIFFLILTISIFNLCQSQVVNLDTYFGENGKVLTNISTGSDRIGCIKVLSDSTILACGTKPFAVSGNVVLTKYQENGQLDNTFGTNGILETDLISESFLPNMMVVQSDGKILVIASKSTNNTSNSITYDFAIRRYLSYGQIDVSFGTNGLVTTDFNQTGDFGIGLALQSDDKIIAVGHTNNVSAATGTKLSLVRFLNNGELDTSFGFNGKLVLSHFAQNSFDYMRTVAIDDVNRIVLGASTNAFETDPQNNTNFALVRLTSDGAIDTSFSSDGIKIIDVGEVDSLSSIITYNSSIVVAGYKIASNISQLCLFKLADNGELDASFANAGILTSNLGILNNQFYLSQCKVINDKIYASGIQNNGANDDFLFISVNPDGTFNTSFNQVGFFTYDFAEDNDLAFAFDVDNNGKIILAGQSRLDGDRNYALIKLNTTILSNQGFSNNRFSVYPNPFTESIFIESRDLCFENSDVEIFDANGRLLYKSEWRENSVFSIPMIPNLTKGNYVLKIRSKSKTEVVKIVKQ